MSQAFEFEIEAEAVEASHLLRVRCSGCGAAALAAPGQQAAALCTACRGGSVVAPELLGRYTPVRGDALCRTRPGTAQGVSLGADWPRWEVKGVWSVTGGPRTIELERPAWCPGPVLGLAQSASAAGWGVRVQWATGSLPHATTGKPGPVRESFAVRCLRDAWGAWAVRRGDAWPFVWLWGETLSPFGLAGLTEMTEWLRDPDACDDRWYASIRARRAQQEIARKEAARLRPKKARSEGM